MSYLNPALLFLFRMSLAVRLHCADEEEGWEGSRLPQRKPLPQAAGLGPDVFIGARATGISINMVCCRGAPVRGRHRGAARRAAHALTSRLISPRVSHSHLKEQGLAPGKESLWVLVVVE